MMSPIASFLTEFRPFGALPPPPPDLVADEPRGEPEPQNSEELHRQAVEAAHRAGARDADARAATALVARESALRAEHAGEIAAARRLWSETEGAALAASFGERLAAFEDRLATAVAAALEPLIATAVAGRAADALRDAIESLLTSGEDRPILVSGPDDLVETLRLSFAGRADLTCTTSPSPDVTIRVGDTAIQSTVATWAERLALEIEGDR